MNDLEEIREFALGSSRQVGRTLGPGGDWLPVLLTVGEKPAVIGFDPGFMASPQAKDRFVAALPDLLRQNQARAAALIISAWERQVSGLGAAEVAERLLAEGIRHDPKRREILIVEVSDGQAEETWVAPIERDSKQIPQLGEWERQDWDHSEGRMAELVKRSLEAARR